MLRRKGPSALGASLCLVATLGAARRADAGPQRRDNGPLFTQIDTGQGAAATARSLAAKGDCARALPLFDAALRSTIDMTIRRDRGLCHEALGNPFPAMDDYRAYLTVSPDAPDAPAIRQRLERLETATGVGGPSVNGPAGSAEAIPTEKADMMSEPGGAVTTDTGKRKAVSRTSYDDEENAYRRYDQSMSSPLRKGTGGIFGVYGEGIAIQTGAAAGLTLPQFTPGFEVGASVRWAFSQVSTVLFQLGYVGYEFSAVGVTSNVGGVDLGAGYEARIALDQYATHCLLFEPVVEYQYISGGSAGGSLNIFIPQGRIGYRGIIGYGFGLELLGDVGASIFTVSVPVRPTFGGTAALLVAF